MLGDTYSGLKEDVKSFIINFHTHVKEQKVTEIENDYQIKFPKLTEQYFSSTRWPSLEVITQLIEAESEKPVNLALPSQWLWDIIDEFLYQFQKYSNFRNRQKHKPEDEVQMRENPRMWSIHSVLNVLYSLVDKSSINQQLSYYAKQGDPDEIADEFGRCALYKMLGFFSLIGLCRLHCLLGDYYTAINVLENIKISRLEMYHDVPTCHITTGYYVGFSYMMMRRYLDAIRTLSATLAYKSRAIGAIAQRADLREYVQKQSDQMSCLLGLCLTLSPVSIDHASVDTDRRDKFSETLLRLQQLDETEFASSFDLGCPKFISPETTNYVRPTTPGSTDSSTYSLEPQRQQIELLKVETSQQIELLRLRSFLKLYTNIPTTKLATYLNTSELSVHMSLMSYKYRLKQVSGLVASNADASNKKGPNGSTALSGVGAVPEMNAPQQLYADLDFFVDGNVIHVADTTVDRRFSEYFVRHIDMLQQNHTVLHSEMTSLLENANPTLFPVRPRVTRRLGIEEWFSDEADLWDGSRQPIDSNEVFDHIRDIRDPEHPHSLEALGVLSEDSVVVNDESGRVSVQFTPTIPGCSMATLIGLAIKVKLLRSLPRRFKIEVLVTPGSHQTDEEITKQLADKERVAAALENPALLKMVNSCLIPFPSAGGDEHEL